MQSELYDWSPLPLNEVSRLFSDLSIPWWIAGGVALELFVGFTIRQHSDIDVGVFREDQLVIQEHLSDWELYEASASRLALWKQGKYLELGVNQVWCRDGPDSPGSLEVMFMECEGNDWSFRRAPQVRGPKSELMGHTEAGIPYLSPEIQLLFKARTVISSKDALDFRTMLPFLNSDKRNWLLSSLKITFPAGHAWIDMLTDQDRRPQVTPYSQKDR